MINYYSWIYYTVIKLILIIIIRKFSEIIDNYLVSLFIDNFNWKADQILISYGDKIPESNAFNNNEEIPVQTECIYSIIAAMVECFLVNSSNFKDN